ncbi:hypothetical protein FBU30_000199 [Linnemannia zychae]|nr:hypothetical protein FBU30_000199 [Linnemannia zychae]
MNSASFPVGLGLTAAAHIYLSNLSWSKTAKYQQRYLAHQRPFNAHILSVSLQDLEKLSSTLQLLDTTIENIEHALHNPRKPSTSELECITSVEIKRWLKFYSQFQATRGVMIRSAAKEMMQTDHNYLDLRTNQICTYLLSSAIVLRHALSTEPAILFMSKYLPHLYKFGSWVAQGLGVNTALLFSSNQFSLKATCSDSSSGSSWGSLLIELSPTLFLSGIHFIAGLRCQWVIRRIQQDRERELLYVKRLCVTSLLLNIRQTRLEWLLMMTESCETFLKRRAAWNVGDIDQDEIDEARLPGQKPPRPSTHDQLKILANDTKSRVYALLNDPHDGHLLEFMAFTTTTNPGRPSPLKTREFSFGPDLERVDPAQFLGDPRERLHIMKLEYLAMKTELELFRDLFAIPKKEH